MAAEYDDLDLSIRSNCVAFARYKVPSLPAGLYDHQSKLDIKNSDTPVAGCIAIENYDHVSYVESVGDGTVTTLHGGFKGNLYGYGDCTDRIVRKNGTPSELGIVGYWIPDSLKEPKVTFSANLSNYYITDEGGKLSRLIHVENGTTQRVGCTLWDNTTGQQLGKYKINLSKTGTFSLDVYVKNNIGVTCVPDHRYKYRFFVVVKDKTYYDEFRYFTTLKATFSNDTSDRMYMTRQGGALARIITVSGATINNIKSCRIGVDFYDAKGTKLKTAEKDYDRNAFVNSGKIYARFLIKNGDLFLTLKPNTYYKFKIYAIINNKRIDDTTITVKTKP